MLPSGSKATSSQSNIWEYAGLLAYTRYSSKSGFRFESSLSILWWFATLYDICPRRRTGFPWGSISSRLEYSA